MKAVFISLCLSMFLPLVAHADFVSVCDRTAPVAAFLAAAATKPCDQITEADLAKITRVAVPGQKIAVFKDGDFSGLPNLITLNIQGNPFTSLPPGLLADLPNLQTLVIFRTGLTVVPDDFLATNPLIENLYMFGNPFAALPEAVWARLATYQHWTGVEFDQKVDDASGNRLSKLFSGQKGVSFVLHANRIKPAQGTGL